MLKFLPLIKMKQKYYIVLVFCITTLASIAQRDTSTKFRALMDTSKGHMIAEYARYDSSKIDTNLRHQLTIKINPGLLFTEQGLLLQYNFNNNFGIELGYGINEDNSGNNGFHTYDGSGYTIRWGLLQYLDGYKHWWFSLQGFYRYYGNITAVAEHSEGFTQGIDDEVINPLRYNLANVTAGDGNQVDVYNADVSVVCFDAVVGYQYRHKHFVFDAFVGAGSRSKNINLHLVGYYVNPVNVNDDPMLPYSSIMSKFIGESYPDFKLGFTLGYRIY